MNRRNKVHWRKTRRERFAFSSLEPRLLLAGDVTVGADYSEEIIGPVSIETPEISCAVDESESQALSKEVGKEVEHQTAECSPTIMELDASFANYDRFDSLVLGNAAYGREANTLTFSDTDTRVIKTTVADGVRYDLNVSNTYYLGETGNTFRFVARESLNSTAAAETMSIVAERKSLNSISTIESVKPSTEGKYFQDLTSTSLSSQTELGQESFNRVGVISQRQMFAVVSPNVNGNVEAGDTFTAKTQLSTRPMTSNSLASFRLQTASSLDLVDYRESISSRSTSNSSRPLNAQFSQQLREQLAPQLTSVREMMRSESSQIEQLNQPRIASATAVQVPSFTSMLYKRIVEPFGKVDADLEEIAVANVERTKYTDDGDLKLARSIQILESAIVLIGLPSSHLCREEERAVNKKSV